eukprot:g6029.t1
MMDWDKHFCGPGLLEPYDPGAPAAFKPPRPPTASPPYFRDCGPVLKPDMADVLMAPDRSKVTFVCPSGLVLRGARTRYCRADKTWSGSPSFCVPLKQHDGAALAAAKVPPATTPAAVEKVGGVHMRGAGSVRNERCGHAPHVAHAMHSQPDSAGIMYQCDAGFEIIGRARVTCHATADSRRGKWSAPPVCTQVRVCKSLTCHRRMFRGIEVQEKGGAATADAEQEKKLKHMCSFDKEAQSCVCLCWMLPKR